MAIGTAERLTCPFNNQFIVIDPRAMPIENKARNRAKT